MSTQTLAQVMEAVHNLTGRIDRVVEGFEIRIQAMRDEHKAECSAMIEKLHVEMTTAMEAVTSHIEGPFEELSTEVEGLIAKVDGRNKSAATKRNMTDADALEILNGKFADLDHKEAALAIGLTYAQVYSARGGYTFKHVTHELEKGGWKNKWEKATKKS